MDIKRSGKSKIKKRVRTSILLVAGLAAAGGITIVLAKLKPAAPTLERSTAVIDSVKRGEMLRQTRGSGTLVPQITRWIPAPSEGRIERVLVQAGVEVKSDTLIAELSNPQIEQQAVDVIDACHLDIGPELQVPGEGHPNAAAHARWAGCLAGVLAARERSAS